MTGADAVVDELTSEQRVAAATTTRNVFIEAGPGTGKTTVSAHRLGVQRFDPRFRHDGRAVVAVSFTRAATKNLVRRVQRLWGPSAMQWPHRVVTLDTIMCDLVHDLLRAGLLRWPNGHATLDVHDSWASFGGSTWNRTAYKVVVVGSEVEIRTGWLRAGRASVPTTVIVPRLLEGTCTHDDVRTVLEQAIETPVMAEFVGERLRASMRVLVVDEVFDANDLDIAIIEAAINADIAVTLVGDPWQALYVFRGARPEVVPLLLQRRNVRELFLTQSFRWKGPEQRELAQRLRAGEPVTLPVREHANGLDDVHVVLALMWKPLWDLSGGVLPLAFHAFKGRPEEAAATLLLNHVTRNIFNLDATYLRDALTALAITDQDVPRQLEPGLQKVAEMLRTSGRPAINAAYGRLVEIVRTVSPRTLRRAHRSHTDRLALVQERLAHGGRPVPGLTTHQAKGGEWDVVAVRLTDSERQILARGLSVTEDGHRKLYVACTRARHHTIELV
jgi:DNA helicase II / ATP-dependent DNA helicase PcrA